MLEMKNTNNDNQLIQELLQIIKQMSGKIDNLEKSNKDILNKLNTKETKLVTGLMIL
jgi:cell shape-determining protein MreC